MSQKVCLIWGSTETLSLSANLSPAENSQQEMRPEMRPHAEVAEGVRDREASGEAAPDRHVRSGRKNSHQVTNVGSLGHSRP